MPGAWGSGNWNNGALDPDTGIYYSVSMTLPGVYAMRSRPARARRSPMSSGSLEVKIRRIRSRCMAPVRSDFRCLKPPYGRITALDINTGEKLWTVANGDGPRDHVLLKELHLPPLGSVGRPAPLSDEDAAVSWGKQRCGHGRSGCGRPGTVYCL